jgi:hypothetical protein
MRYNDGSEELYDMVKDPKQFTNQAANPEYANQLAKLQTRLDHHIKEKGLRVKSAASGKEK